MPSGGGGSEADAGYLMLRVLSVDCALAADPTPFEPGGPAGFPSRRNSWDAVEVVAGATVVEVEDTTLTGADLDTVPASLASVDMDALVTQAAAMAEDMEAIAPDG